jgi:hypothetical protein
MLAPPGSLGEAYRLEAENSMAIGTFTTGC